MPWRWSHGIVVGQTHSIELIDTAHRVRLFLPLLFLEDEWKIWRSKQNRRTEDVMGTRQSRWVETGAFPWRVGGGKFCSRFFYPMRGLRHATCHCFNSGTLPCTVVEKQKWNMKSNIRGKISVGMFLEKTKIKWKMGKIQWQKYTLKNKT